MRVKISQLEIGKWKVIIHLDSFRSRRKKKQTKKRKPCTKPKHTKLCLDEGTILESKATWDFL